MQGEGFWAGRAAVFVRFVGCNMWSGYERTRKADAERNKADCPLWCDTDFTKDGSEEHTAFSLARLVRQTGGDDTKFVVFTGGEPFLQMDDKLITTFHLLGIYCAVETNGTVSALETFRNGNGSVTLPDWITVSPKVSDQRTIIELCNEVKLVVPDYTPSAYPGLVERCQYVNTPDGPRKMLWLQPVDLPDNPEQTDYAKNFALHYVMSDSRWRLSVQTHKIVHAP
jgi:7-carboxy-7-deazaguanine synthase